jgi:hypothetical protein
MKNRTANKLVHGLANGLALYLCVLGWLFSGCQLAQEQNTRYTLSFFKQYTVLNKFDSVEITLKYSNGMTPAVIFHHKVEALRDIVNLEAPGYNGKAVTILISGFNAKKLVYQIEKFYNGAKGKTDSTRQIVGTDSGASVLGAPVMSSLNPGDTKVTVSWRPISGAVAYNLYYGEGGTVNDSSPSFKGTLSPFELSGLKNNMLYRFALTSVDANGETALGPSLTAIPRGASPDAPILGAVTPGDKQVTIIWTPVTGATSSILYYQAGTSVDKSSSNKVGVVSPYVLSGLSNGSIYAFVLTAITANGESAVSNIVTTTPRLSN